MNLVTRSDDGGFLADAEEVRAFREGDREAFERLVDRYQRRVLRVCQRLLGTGEDAKDAFQESFLQAFAALPRLRDPRTFRTWLFRIVVRKARRLQRRRGIERGALSAEPASGVRGPDPTELAEEVARLRHALAELPARQREVLVLRHYEGFRYEEVARILGIREDAARASHYQGLRRLRAVLRSGRDDDS